MSREEVFLPVRSPAGSGVTLKLRFLRYSSSDMACKLDVDFKWQGGTFDNRDN